MTDELRRLAKTQDPKAILKTAFETKSAKMVESAPAWLAERIESRPLSPPHVLFRQHRTIIDPYHGEERPTRAEYFGWAKLDEEGRRDLVGDLELSPEEEREWLNEVVDWEEMSDMDACLHDEKGPGIRLWDGLIGLDPDEVDLALVEGWHPGSSFVGLCYEGPLRKLNRWFLKNGVNVVVIEYGD